jgi:CheY-like chemotaxis protein
MAETPRPAAPVDPARLGGAAADFAAGLGRKVTELRASLTALAGNPDRERGRNELRRKLHALGVGARLLHFEILARAITGATERIDEEASQGRVSDALLRELGELLDRIPELAWTKDPAVPESTRSARPPAPSITIPPPSSRRLSSMPPAAEPLPRLARVTPFVVLVVGAEPLARAVEDDPAFFPCEVERSDALSDIVPLARAVAPDLVVFDVDPEGADAALEALIDDPLCGPLPIVALGKFDGDASRQRLVALGVTKVVDKPATPALIRRLCRELLGEPGAATHAVPSLGELSVAELADVIAEEVRKRLVDALEPDARARRVDLGVGGEVLGPIWGALARVRDVVEARSDGALRFHDPLSRTPISVAPSEERGERRVSTGRRSGAGRGLEVDLEGRAIVLADDDPQVVWYLGDILRGAGATVIEARDGREALALARQVEPEAVVSDVLMPRLDGVGLVHALERDVVLHDRPVILLSWKEDLLKRLRDLRTETSAMLRKDEGASTILARVREVLAGRVRVEARIAAGGEIRGRLDGLSVASLLSIVDRVRHDATVIVRDATSAFELDLDGGGLRALTQTDGDGDFVHGEAALAPLLGVLGGRFLVRPFDRNAPISDAARLPRGELRAQLAPVVRRLRSATDAVSGERLLDLVEVALDATRLTQHLAPLPPSMRRLAERIAAGAAPRELVLSGEYSPSTLQDLLLDLASRGLVVRVRGREGGDLIAASATELDLATAQAAAPRSLPASGGTTAEPPANKRREAPTMRSIPAAHLLEAGASGVAAAAEPSQPPGIAETEPTRRVDVPTATLTSLAAPAAPAAKTPTPTPPPLPSASTAASNADVEPIVETQPFGTRVEPTAPAATTAVIAVTASPASPAERLMFAKTLSATPTPIVLAPKSSPHTSTLHGVGGATLLGVGASSLPATSAATLSGIASTERPAASAVASTEPEPAPKAAAKSDAPPATMRESPSARKLRAADPDVMAPTQRASDAVLAAARVAQAPVEDGPPASLRPGGARTPSPPDTALTKGKPEPAGASADEPAREAPNDNVMWWLVAALVAILALGFLLVNHGRDGAPDKAAPPASSGTPAPSNS